MKQYKAINAERTKEALMKGLTYAEVAILLGVSSRTVERRVKAWNLPHLPTGARKGSKNIRYVAPEDRLAMKGGYIQKYHPEHPNHDFRGYVLEHRIVMEKVLGRLLTKKEVVHHKDHNKVNNDPDNLMLFPCQAAHVAYEKREREEAARAKAIEAAEIKYGLPKECPF
jgi:hypothetical protein